MKPSKINAILNSQERDRQTERQTNRQRQTERNRETKIQTHREREGELENFILQGL